MQKQAIETNCPVNHECWVDLCRLVHLNPAHVLATNWESAVHRVVAQHMMNGAEDFIDYARAAASSYRKQHLH